MDNKYYYIGGIVIIGILIICFGFMSRQTQGMASSGFLKNASDVIGTKTGTTTTAVGFSINAQSAGQSATSTYISKLGGRINQADYTFKVQTASSTANLHFSFLGSNDDFCDTSTTTTIYDVVTQGQINWYDASSYLWQPAAVPTVLNSTSTVIWDTSNMVAKGQTLSLRNLDFECLALQVSGSSTMVSAQLKTK